MKIIQKTEYVIIYAEKLFEAINILGEHYINGMLDSARPKWVDNVVKNHPSLSEIRKFLNIRIRT